MRLLVSVSSAEEARAAIEGGADIIDAKDPHTGALGPVTLDVLASIRQVVGPAHLLTAAIGDVDENGDGRRATGDSAALTEIESRAHVYAQAGAALVKVGCVGDVASAGPLLAAAVRGASRAGAGVVAVAYADASGPATVTLDTVIDLARAVGARGVLVDTADKRGPGLTSRIVPDRLAEWVSSARQAELLAAVAGSLSLADLPAVATSGADVVGVRGAACEEGRLGRVTAQRVAMLAASLALSARG
jgi:uncharacterized protein (UPF0264 family)